jgi:hypothetical protein
MADSPQTCSNCQSVLQAGATECGSCGWRVGRASWGKWIAIILAIVIAVAGLAGWLWHLSSTKESAKDSRVSAEIVPVEGRSAFVINGVLRVDYHDLGSMVEIAIEAKGNPVLYVDMNHDGTLENGISYTAVPDGTICAQRLSSHNDTGPCGSFASAAKAHIVHEGNSWNVVWRIPKREIQDSVDSADVAIQVFHDETQAGEYYPGPPFRSVYRLRFAAAGQQSRMGAPIEGDTARNMERPSPPTAEKPRPSSPALPDNNRSGSGMPLITRFEATPETLERGATSSLRWVVSGGDAVTIEPGIGSVGIQGEKVVTPTQTTRYKLIAKGPHGTSSSEVTVLVAENAPPQIVSFQAVPPTVQTGESARLQWNVSGRTTRVRLEPGFDSLPSQGEREVPVTRTTDFKLTAEGPGGIVSNVFTVHTAAPSPPSVRFDVDSVSIHQGENATLRWTVTGAARISIEPGINVNTNSGSARVRPLNTTRYTLNAEGPGGTVTRDVTVTVTKPIGPSSGVIVWNGIVHGVQLITIDRDHVDVGSIQGSLPGLPCIVQPASDKGVSIASAPAPQNNFERLVLRIQGNGPRRVVIAWSLQ